MGTQLKSSPKFLNRLRDNKVLVARQVLKEQNLHGKVDRFIHVKSYRKLDILLL